MSRPTPRKINAILLSTGINISQPKLVNTSGYKLAIYWQNFMEMYLAWLKIVQKVFLGGLLFWLTL